MSADNEVSLQPAEDGRKPKRPRRPKRSKAPEHDFSKLTFRTDATDKDVSLVLVALRRQFEEIRAVIDTLLSGTDGADRASYVALGGAAIAQGLIERLDGEEGP